ncbi:MAG: SLC13 family permease [Burkholderiaceae bacterium]
MPIGAGDSLLIEGSEDAIANACRWLSLVAVGEPLRRRAGREATIALIVFALVIVLAISKLVPIAVAAVLGVLACVVAGIADWEEIESAVEWRIVLIVASSIALGDALVSSGAMLVVAARLAEWTASWPLTATIAAVITATGLLTNFVSNNAAAAIMTPLGLQLATQLGAQPEAFVLGVLFGANLCFLTPMAYQTNLLVMAAGEYRFSDYVKVGLPLFALMVPLLALALGYGFT